ncbi:uncharacterized protein LOC127740710 [Arachis duranensis]|uniref:Uncharacterized protein LOC127740710 n=1 Tax=Arachis duranensis TaxID=130453 RepID=A0A9C6WNF4_ARADU|nr:uncharacterized protein LOC127740710 [Arachis duranensis]
MLDALHFTDADLFLLPPFYLLHIHTLLTNVNNNINNNYCVKSEYLPPSLFLTTLNTPLSLSRVPAPPAPSLLRAAVGIAISSSLSSPPLSSSSSAALNSCLCPRLRSLSRRSANVPLCRRGLFSSPLQTVALRTVARSSSSASSLSVNLYSKPRPRELILLRVHSLSNFILLQPFLPLRSTPIRPLNY